MSSSITKLCLAQHKGVPYGVSPLRRVSGHSPRICRTPAAPGIVDAANPATYTPSPTGL
jgi:hypothetical protein